VAGVFGAKDGAWAARRGGSAIIVIEVEALGALEGLAGGAATTPKGASPSETVALTTRGAACAPAWDVAAWDAEA